jgi:hypothetical protein
VACGEPPRSKSSRGGLTSAADRRHGQVIGMG